MEVVLKNNNIYIKAPKHRVQVVDENSSVEFVNEHYKTIDKTIYEEYSYNLDSIIDKKFKIKYSSINGFFKSCYMGIKKIANFSILKKILLLGFFASSMFIMYAVSNIAGTLNIDESEFITADRNYLQAEQEKLSVEKFLEYEKLDSIDYIIPGNGEINLNMQIKDYYQLQQNAPQTILSGKLTSLDIISNNDIVSGRIPQNEREIVIDKMIYDNMAYGSYNSLPQKGINSAEELLNREVSCGSIDKLTIVGIVDRKSPSIYANKNIFVNLLNESQDQPLIWYGAGGYMTDSSTQGQTKVADYSLYLDDITLTKGRMPENDCEVIVNSVNASQMKLNKTIEEKINGVNLKVVGYYNSMTDRQDYLVNNNTVKYNEISEKTGIMIYPKDKETVLNKFRNEFNINLENTYEKARTAYIKERQDSIRSGVIFAGVILAISLIEIYLMERSSFLSRIKEVGVLRAIGAKKTDIYKMFLGEIIAITTIAGMSGLMLMTYILYGFARIPYVGGMFVVNFETVGISILLIYVFNIVVGLLPLYRVLRRTPAEILARHDIE